MQAMKRCGVVLAAAFGVGCLVVPAVTLAMGGGGMGGGSGRGMGMGSEPSAPQYDPSVEYQRGTEALQAGKYRDAAADFQHVIEASPRTASAWLMLGLAKAGAGDDRGAEQAYQRAVKLDGASVQAHRELALEYVKLKQMDKASGELAALQAWSAKCADACPEAADLKAAIASVQAEMPAPAGAPGPAPAASNDGVAHLSLATPEAGDGAYVRAVSLINEQRWDEALASLAKAEAVFGPHPDILTYEGYVWRHKGDWARAEGYYRQALAEAPSHRGATEYYGELKVLEGDRAGARAMLAKLDAICTFGCAEAEELRSWIAHGGDPAA
jgi:tetratricopeptide (TPR) repeat protein